jgi:chromate reductase, NAD(P)H dehydrogenase (quinone)
MEKTMKILALAGSNSPNSINKQLLNYASNLTGQTVTILDMTIYDNLPFYSTLRQQSDGFPPEIEALYAQIQAHDGILIASPEHNGSIPAVFKNVIDWLSRIDMKFLGQKPVLLLSTAPGPNGGRTNLAQLANLVPWWGADLIGTYSLGKFQEAMQNGLLIESEHGQLVAKIGLFLKALNHQKTALVA